MPHKNTSQPMRATTGSGLFAAYLLLLLWLPIPLGSARPWSEAFMAAASLVLLLVWLLICIKHKQPWLAAHKAFIWPLSVMLLWVLWQALQLIPLPAFLLQWLSPQALAFHTAAFADQARGWHCISLTPGATVFYLLRSASYSAILILSLGLLNSRKRMRIFLWLLVISGLAQVSFGLLNMLSQGAFSIRGIDGPWSSNYGTYVNRNHFAGFLEMVIPAAIALLMSQPARHHHKPNIKARIKALAAWMLSGRLVRYLLVITLMGGMLLSTSRGGNLAMLASLGLATSLFSRARLRHAWLLLVLLAAAFFFMGGGELEKRLLQEGLHDDRIDIRAAIYPAIGDFMLSGSGAGSFEQVFPPYKNAQLSALRYQHAHNDYLQLILENGVLMALLLFAMQVYVLWIVAKALLKRRDLLLRAALFAAFAGMSGMLIHAWYDFNFQIPANAALFFSLMGMGLAASQMESRQRRRRSRSA
ncbi:MAG: O-antigen ligase family protein [gamma proteobacterium symbiont of Bathyaustriella thionipta]|nr:O-antigen ligase family protein [gamma proteobacterium symbiont of Bathyaustriella thionipta]